MDVSHLRTSLSSYATKYKHISMRREDGILEMRLHSDGGPLQWGRMPHAELEEAFLNVGRDRENRVVILTGTGDEFSGPRAEPQQNRKYHQHDADEWGELAWESTNFLLNMLRIDVPMISAINGPALRHPELPLLGDIVLATDTACFQDSAHFVGGLVPGDGVHVLFSLMMGVNRARYFLLTGQVIGAEEAKAVGLVNEIVPADQLLERAWEHARAIAAKPDLHRRFSRTLIVEQIRRQLADLLPYGLALEALASQSRERW